MSLQYVIERHTHGWLVCAPSGQHGIPVNALEEIAEMYSAESVMDAGIARHYRVTNTPAAVYAITTAKESEEWRKEIEAELNRYESMSPYSRWWLGTDVGMSSAAIFVRLSPYLYLDRCRKDVEDYAQRQTPRDSDDLGRCLRLLARFPEWEARLGEVAAAYPGTAWPRIIDRWPELKAADSKRQCEILNECHKETSP